tara:strand:+ start:1352 stop:2359 length:1008 start_codon:yes stop_codon:yes gene_type:complete
MQANTEKTELALKQASTEINAFVVNAAAEVAAIEEKYGTEVPDATSKDGYNRCKSIRRDLLPVKTGLEGARKTLKAPILAAGKLVDSELKPLVDRVDDVIKPFENAYREVDNEKKRKEEERQANVQAAFDRMANVLMDATGATSSVIEGLIDDFGDFDFDPDVFQERTDEAVGRHAEIMDKLTSILTKTIAEEEQAKRIAEIEERERAIREKEEAEARRVEEERQRVEREKAAAEAAERAKKEAEEAHEREKLVLEAKAKREAEAAAENERRRIEKERQREEEEAKAREADRKYRAGVHNEILETILTTGITEDQGKAIIKLAASGKAGNMKVYY